MNERDRQAAASYEAHCLEEEHKAGEAYARQVAAEEAWEAFRPEHSRSTHFPHDEALYQRETQQMFEAEEAERRDEAMAMGYEL